MPRHALCLLFVLLAACDDEPPTRPSSPPDRPPARVSRPAESASASTAPSEAPAPAPSRPPPSEKRDLDQRCEPAPADAPPLAIVDFKLTSKLENKRPTDELGIVRAGTPIYAYLVVENLEATKRCVLVTFRVNGKKRASLTLAVGTSPAWRTWAHIKPEEGDAPGAVQVEITDDHGRQRYQQKLLIEP